MISEGGYEKSEASGRTFFGEVAALGAALGVQCGGQLQLLLVALVERLQTFVVQLLTLKAFTR